MFVSRSSLEKPRPFERFWRTMSPSRTSSLAPRLRISLTRTFVIVVLPDPESPVNQRQKPFSVAIGRRLLSVCVDQDRGNLFPRELVRRRFAAREHLPYLGPRQEEMRLLGVRARLVRGHSLAVVAPEGVLEEQRLDPELADVDVVEDPLRVVGAVVIAHAGVVAADDEVGTAVVAADDRVEHRLARPRVVHLRRVDAED